MKIRALLAVEIDVDEHNYTHLDVNSAIGDMEVFNELQENARTVTTECLSIQVIEEEVSLYDLFIRTFGFEPSDSTFEQIYENIQYALIDCGVSLKKIVRLAKDFYDKHENHQDDIPYCFATALKNEGLM
ncbi:hypothetical protein ACFVS2_21730 [Brevibacillus sp. NPDC058079]|uniref:hypothetical protein n=1 Tax=Brevibacillus sp. NPDC058079 TaxID=3346330 RepID=UPI0036EA20A8